MRISIEGDMDEIEDRLGITITASEGAKIDVSANGLSKKERLVLKAVKRDPGKALRSIQQTVADLDGSPWEYSGSWDDDREEVQSILGTLRNRDLVEVEGRSYYPTDE